MKTEDLIEALQKESRRRYPAFNKEYVNQRIGELKSRLIASKYKETNASKIQKIFEKLKKAT